VAGDEWDPQRNRHESDRDRVDRERDRLSRINVISLFDRLGYDVTEASEIKRLNENLTFLERERKRREAMNSNKMKVVGAILVGALGAVSTYLINWVVNKIIPGGISPK
jgi:di/tricarboxylate transporter